MKTVFHKAIVITATAAVLSFASVLSLAQEHPSPVRMNPDRMAGLGLTPVSNAGFIDILVDGTLEFESASLFTGEELRAVMTGRVTGPPSRKPMESE